MHRQLHLCLDWTDAARAQVQVMLRCLLHRVYPPALGRRPACLHCQIGSILTYLHRFPRTADPVQEGVAARLCAAAGGRQKGVIAIVVLCTCFAMLWLLVLHWLWCAAQRPEGAKKVRCGHAVLMLWHTLCTLCHAATRMLLCSCCAHAVLMPWCGCQLALMCVPPRLILTGRGNGRDWHRGHGD